MGVTTFIDTILKFGLALVERANLKESRKYVDQLYELKKQKLALDSLPNEEVDDVKYVEVLKDIQLTLEAILNDPELKSK